MGTVGKLLGLSIGAAIVGDILKKSQLKERVKELTKAEPSDKLDETIRRLPK